MSQRTLAEATIKIKDGTGTPLEIVVKIGEGNITFSEKRAVEYTLDRGTLDTVRLGDEEPVDVSFDFTWEWLKSSTLTTTSDNIRDIIKGVTPYVSTSSDDCEPYACDIEVAFDPACGDIDETIVLADFRYEEMSYDLSAGTVSVTGKCNLSTLTFA